MLERLKGHVVIDNKRVAHMNSERMESRRKFALAAAQAGFEVGIDEEAPIKVDVEKNLLGFRMNPHPGGCDEKTLLAVAFNLIDGRLEKSESTEMAMKLLITAYNFLEVADRQKQLGSK
jgi:hypothetical protein